MHHIASQLFTISSQLSVQTFQWPAHPRSYLFSNPSNIHAPTPYCPCPSPNPPQLQLQLQKKTMTHLLLPTLITSPLNPRRPPPLLILLLALASSRARTTLELLPAPLPLIEPPRSRGPPCSSGAGRTPTSRRGVHGFHFHAWAWDCRGCACECPLVSVSGVSALCAAVWGRERRCVDSRARTPQVEVFWLRSFSMGRARLVLRDLGGGWILTAREGRGINIVNMIEHFIIL